MTFLRFFNFFLIFNIKSGGSRFVSVCTLIMEEHLLFCATNKKILDKNEI